MTHHSDQASQSSTGDQHSQELLERARYLPQVAISSRSQCDLEMLATGAFVPVQHFMGKADYQRVLTEMRLDSGELYPIPITLPLQESDLQNGVEEICLTCEHGRPLAILQIEEVFPYDPLREARLALGTTDVKHPLVAEMASWGELYVSGPMQVLDLPQHRKFGGLCMTPAQVRLRLAEMGLERVVAFQTRNPMHRVHEELTKHAAEQVSGGLLIHPVVGLTKPGDVATEQRVRVYRALVQKYYNPRRTLLSLLPLAMRLAGPREALWHAIIRRNYGATHLIVGRDHAGPGKNEHGEPFYCPYEAQLILEQYCEETGVIPVAYREWVYLPDEDRYEEAGKVPDGARVFSISGSQVRKDYLAKGKRLPAWFTRPEVADILQGNGTPCPRG